MNSRKIRVAILDDHQGVIDGYYFRLGQRPEIELVGTAAFGEELDALLAARPVDVLILDISVPTSPTNANPYPILYVIPTLLERFPSLAILVISMLTERTLIKAVLDAGASGYILKDDVAAIRDLAAVVISVAGGGIYFSRQANEQLLKYAPKPGEPTLTPREREAISLSAAYPGEALASLARQMGISHSTLRNLLHTAYARLGVRNRSEAILKAQELGLLMPPVGRG